MLHKPPYELHIHTHPYSSLQSPPNMSYKPLELVIQSAQGLKYVNHVKKMKPYAVVFNRDQNNILHFSERKVSVVSEGLSSGLMEHPPTDPNVKQRPKRGVNGFARPFVEGSGEGLCSGLMSVLGTVFFYDDDTPDDDNEHKYS